MRYLLRFLFPCLLLLSGCGGGGSNPTPEPGVPVPTQFKAVAGANADQVILSWVAPAALIDGYELEGRIGEEAFQKIHTGLIPSEYTWVSISFSASAPEMTVFAFRLRAAKGTLYSGYSSEATHTRGPNAPLSVTSQMDWGQNGVTVAWTRNSSVSDGVTVERSECSAWGGLIGTWVTLAVSDPQATTFLDSSTQPSRYYTYRVTNKKGNLSSAPSNTSSPVFTGMPAPSQVVGNYDWAEGAIRLVWTRNTDGADRVKIERAECSAWGSPSGEWATLAFSDSLATTCLDHTFRMGAYYLYRITNLRGSLASEACSSYPVFAGLPAPSYVAATWDATRLGLQVNWASNTTAADSLKLERSECDGNGNLIGNWSLVANPSANMTAYFDPSVEEGRSYYYRATNVRGTVESGTTQSSYWTRIPLLAPVNLQVANTASGFRLIWENRSKVATEVVVRRALGNSGWSSSSSNVALLAPGATEYEDAGMSLGYYTYYVVAKQGYQEASCSGVSAVTVNPAGALSLNGYVLGLPDGSDASLRSTGTWAFATRSPFGVRANTGDTWPAYFPPNVSVVPSPCLKVDSKGWPHLIFTRANPQNAKEYVVTHDWYDGDSWESEEVAKCQLHLSSAQDGIEFSLDKSGEAHVLLDRITDGNTGGGSTDDLTYFHKVDGAWVSESLATIQPKITNIGTFQIFMDGLNRPHILLGNWASIVECTKDTQGTWSGQVLPTGNVSAGWYDYFEGLWADSNNGWLFYERSGSSNASMSYSLVVLEKKNGVWLEPVVLGGRAHDGSSTTAKAALSDDHTRVAVAYRSTHGLQVFHQDQTGWHQTLAGPDPGSYQLLRIGFDGSNLLHLIHHFGDGFKEYREQAPASGK